MNLILNLNGSPWDFNNMVGVDGGCWWEGGGPGIVEGGGDSMEAWGCLHNTKVGVSGCMCVIRQRGGWGGSIN